MTDPCHWYERRQRAERTLGHLWFVLAYLYIQRMEWESGDEPAKD